MTNTIDPISYNAGGWREDMENAPRKNWERLDLLSVYFDGYSECSSSRQ